MSSRAVEFFIGACVGSIAAGVILGISTAIAWIIHCVALWWVKRRVTR